MVRRFTERCNRQFVNADGSVPVDNYGLGQGVLEVFFVVNPIVELQFVKVL